MHVGGNIWQTMYKRKTMLHQWKQKEYVSAGHTTTWTFEQAWFEVGLCYLTHCHTWHNSTINRVLFHWSPLFFLNQKGPLIRWGGARNWATTFVNLIFHVIKSYTFPWIYLFMFLLISFNTPNLNEYFPCFGPYASNMADTDMKWRYW